MNNLRMILFLIFIASILLLSTPTFAMGKNPEVTYVSLLNDRTGYGPYIFQLQGWNLSGGFSYAFYPLQENGNPKEYPVGGKFLERVNEAGERLYVAYEPAQAIQDGLYTLVVKHGEQVLSPVNQHTIYMGTIHRIVPLNMSVSGETYTFVLEGEHLAGGFQYEISRILDDGNNQVWHGEFSEMICTDGKALIVTFKPGEGAREGRYSFTVAVELGENKKRIQSMEFNLSLGRVEGVSFDELPGYAYIRITFTGQNLVGGYHYELHCLDESVKLNGSLAGQFIEEVVTPTTVVLAFIPDQSSFVEARYKLVIYGNGEQGQADDLSPHNVVGIHKTNITGRSYGE